MKIKIEENWKGIEEIEKQVQEKTGDPEAKFNANSFFFGETGRALLIPVKYRSKKGKKGSEDFTTSYKEMMVVAEFCPFTGKPLYKDIES